MFIDFFICINNVWVNFFNIYVLNLNLNLVSGKTDINLILDTVYYHCINRFFPMASIWFKIMGQLTVSRNRLFVK